MDYVTVKEYSAWWNRNVLTSNQRKSVLVDRIVLQIDSGLAETLGLCM